MIDTPFSIMDNRNTAPTIGCVFVLPTFLIIRLDADKSVQTGANGSGQPKTGNKITSATFTLSEVFGAIETNDAWIGNVSDGD